MTEKDVRLEWTVASPTSLFSMFECSEHENSETAITMPLVIPTIIDFQI